MSLESYRMKIKHLIGLLVFAILISLVGSLFKILHWNFGNEILLIGVVIKLIIGIALIFKILTTEKFNEFLNW